MTLEEIIAHCDRQIEIAGEKASAGFRIPGRWGKSNTRRLWKGGPVGEIVNDWREISPLPTGCVVAVADLVECRKSEMNHSYMLVELVGEKDTVLFDVMENDFGDFTSGRYAWEMTNVRRLPEPIPVKGKQGLWNWEGEMCTQSK